MFNFVNRHESAGWSAITPLLYAISVLYLLTPAAAWLIGRQFRRQEIEAETLESAATPVIPADAGIQQSATGFRVKPGMTANQRRITSTNWRVSTLSVLVAVPFALFAILSLVKQIGLHWLLSFVPFVLIWLVVHLAPTARKKLEQFFVGFAFLHVVVVATIAMLPLETWQDNRRYEGAVLTFAHQELALSLAPALADKEKNWVLAMDGYSNAVTLGYNLRQYVMVFGQASSHARHDDILTDYRKLDGSNILILRKSEPNLQNYRPFFRTLSVDSFNVRGARFWQVKGEGFDYPVYREKVLVGVKQKYYAIPPWLPQRGCYFCDRYFPDEQCCR